MQSINWFGCEKATVKHLHHNSDLYKYTSAEFALNMNIKQAYVPCEDNTMKPDRGEQASCQTPSFLHFFAVALGSFGVGKSTVLLDRTLPKLKESAKYSC